MTPKVAAPAPPPRLPPGVKTAAVVRILELFNSLSEYDRGGRDPRKRFISFEVSDADVNEYLAYSLSVKPRPGVAGATAKFLADNQIDLALQFSVDFPKPLLAARTEVRIRVKFEAERGTLNFDLQDALGQDQKIVPKEAMNGALRFLAAQQPEVYDTTHPIPLPFGLQRVWTKAGIMAGETMRP